MTEANIKFEDLRLMPGQILQLEFDGYSDTRDRSTLIGYRQNHAIIVSTPRVNGIPVPVAIDSGVNVRLFCSRLNGACAFRTSVVQISSRPFPHLYLSPPDSLELGEVRKSLRTATEVIASVNSTNVDRASAIIRDISTDGAQIVSKQLQGAAGDEITLKFKFEVADIERVISVAGIIRTVNETDSDTSYGVQFKDVQDIDRITLHGFVLSQLHKPTYGH